ncbi:SusE domain-containing protein [Litoribacter alkaliphilus]|uniref:SusE domain-containing protein n=1 Tax=Litoribacter ruber TaxID=702568 RepID=A0AAP2G6F2_9BACT|nr:SusE domain-containing protein [Litoribacter alkaliphilus]MBS9525638.1 SusE domain-containing protein [Litoribacter alkaliphilus]
MKASINLLLILVISALAIWSCSEDEQRLNIEIVSMGTLESPAIDEHINIDPENGEAISFNWRAAQAGDGGLVLYNVLFDKEGGDFNHPVASFPSADHGASLTFSLTHSTLNSIAANAGIEQMTTGNIIWTVQASSGYNKEIFPEKHLLTLSRPEGIANIPAQLFIYGGATEGEGIQDAVALKKILHHMPNDEVEDNTFETITQLRPGDFNIVNDKDSGQNYYINEGGNIREGDEPSTFEGEEGVYRLRINFSNSRVAFEKISNLELIILANGASKAELEYVGNHVFEGTGYFDFLTPGAPEAPDWLGWEEERYKFRFQLGEEEDFLGSNMNDDMNASLIANLGAYNDRPNGDEPPYYYQVYFLGTEASQWQGAWKFSNQFNGTPFKVRVVFDPLEDDYFHEMELE